jgi:hypothetical protein
MTVSPDQHMIDRALQIAAQSPCRSKRGVTLYDMRTGAFRGAGFNGPPGGCPGRAVCAGTCGQRSVHAEVRALREAAVYIRYHPPGPYDLIHVELAADGGVVACSGPSCSGCAAQILDVGFVGGVWLYEMSDWLGLRIPPPDGKPFWRRYSAEEFNRVTLQRCGVPA